MDIVHELLRKEAERLLDQKLSELETDAGLISANSAVSALSEIQEVISNGSYSDFVMIDKIVDIFEKYGISTNGCHDFG